jgi:hypothetical protein
VSNEGAASNKSKPIELSDAHIAAVTRQRQIYVNNDVGYDSVAMGPKVTAITPDQWLAARFGAFDQPGSQVDWRLLGRDVSIQQRNFR